MLTIERAVRHWARRCGTIHGSQRDFAGARPASKQSPPLTSDAVATRLPGWPATARACKNAGSSEAYFYRKYKLTQRQLVALREAQQDRCGICGAPGPEHLDHDHATGKIRKLLCQRCNQGLGLFRDEPYLLQVAALYVQGHKQQQAFETLVEAARSAEDGASRPGEPPVGSHRRPGARSTSTRSTGRNSGARRRTQAGEADG
jgi:hypothetical protein